MGYQLMSGHPPTFLLIGLELSRQSLHLNADLAMERGSDMSADSKNESTRVGLWHSLLDAEMNLFYWTEVSGRMANHDRWLKFFVAATSSGTAIAAWTIWNVHPSIWKCVTGLSSVVSLYHTFFFSSDRLKKSSTLVGIWKEIAIRYKLLWEEDPTLSQPKMWKEYEKEKQREVHVDETLFKRDVKLIKQAQAAVRKARGIK